MKRRADRWNADAYPFGSEMAWDSTGQEEIHPVGRGLSYFKPWKSTMSLVTRHSRDGQGACRLATRQRIRSGGCR